MHTQHEITAHSLYVLYQALPEQSKRLFLQELLGDQAELPVSAVKNRQPRQSQLNQDGNHFADICGILTATKSVFLEEMEQMIRQQGKQLPLYTFGREFGALQGGEDLTWVKFND